MCQLEESLHDSEVSYRCHWIYLQISCSSSLCLVSELGSLLNGDLYLLYVAYPQLRKFENNNLNMENIFLNTSIENVCTFD